MDYCITLKPVEVAQNGFADKKIQNLFLFLFFNSVFMCIHRPGQASCRHYNNTVRLDSRRYRKQTVAATAVHSQLGEHYQVRCSESISCRKNQFSVFNNVTANQILLYLHSVGD